MIQQIDYGAVAPVLVTALGAVVVLLAGAFEVPGRVLGWLTAGVSLGGLVAVFVLAGGGVRTTFCIPETLRDGGAASCSYSADNFTLVFQGIVLAAAALVVLLSLADLTLAKVPLGEYYFLLLCSVTGALTLVAARDLVLLAVGLETLALPVFALVALKRYDGRATEAAVKLLLVSVASAAVLLFGISLVYGATGALHFDRIATAAVTPELAPVLTAGIVLVICGFAFKVAAVPFHAWTPDVYQGAPLPVAAFLSVVSKAGGFAGLGLVAALAFPGQGDVWGPLLAVLAALTMTVGNVLALRQTHAVRLLAWSSVAQSGYMLAPLAVGEETVTVAVASMAGYLGFYAVMNLGAFAVVTGFADRRQGREGEEGNLLASYRGLARWSPAEGLALAFFLICLAGLPPGIMGLIAKVVVFEAVMTGPVVWLAVVMALNTVIGLYYYARWAILLFAPEAEASEGMPRALSFRLALGVTALGAVVLSVLPNLLLHATLAVG
ncbi:NADH-quinone oxidoreductase subunit N [Actinocorallia sp. A-T 12471]|uniref:NADH-quinone oxidoreductase subunit N n=1 Tax=Actinocorallia sp. A-T 12471 TaxID=3089813 RepID=UPI0029CD6E71|nr:NADH-quinone oxidoreductase subunit N [Actinocorallia sp. A-T 12471]MDX6741693.1 NADH-quinone oxidoreductase subunit N [Actinocorallia sp. A-T 12471]